MNGLLVTVPSIPLTPHDPADERVKKRNIEEEEKTSIDHVGCPISKKSLQSN